MKSNTSMPFEDFAEKIRNTVPVKPEETADSYANMAYAVDKRAVDMTLYVLEEYHKTYFGNQ